MTALIRLIFSRFRGRKDMDFWGYELSYKYVCYY